MLYSITLIHKHLKPLLIAGNIAKLDHTLTLLDLLHPKG